MTNLETQTGPSQEEVDQSTRKILEAGTNEEKLSNALERIDSLERIVKDLVAQLQRQKTISPECADRICQK